MNLCIDSMNKYEPKLQKAIIKEVERLYSHIENYNLLRCSVCTDSGKPVKPGKPSDYVSFYIFLYDRCVATTLAKTIRINGWKEIL